MLHLKLRLFSIPNIYINNMQYKPIRFVIPVVFIIKLDWSVCICLTQLYDGRDMYRIYYIKNNYMFRHFTLAIFRFRNEKNLVSSYTRLMWVVYSGEVRGEVGTRSRMCCVGWVVWVHGFCYYMLSPTVYSVASCI